MGIKDIEPRTIRARELYGDFWFNSEPVPISALKGQVILIDFWDYTCVSSQRVLPYVAEWSRKYRPFGLVIVGVHTPKFPFGKDPELVQRAVARLGIEFPIVMDNEHIIASRYDNRVWPTLHLIDKNGFVRYQVEGEGHHWAAERALQTLLYEAGVGEELPVPMEPPRDEDRSGPTLYKAMPELFTGYLKGSIGNVEGYAPESVVEYVDPEVYIKGRFYAAGSWLNQKYSLELVPQGKTFGEIVVPYQALEANAVLSQKTEKRVEVTLTQDDQFLTKENRGGDVQIAAGGRSYVLLDEPRSYALVKNKELGEHTLRLRATTGGWGIHSFTFVSSVIPELIGHH